MIRLNSAATLVCIVLATCLCTRAEESAAPATIQSPVITGDSVTFNYHDPTAFSVSVTGDFNQWSINSHLMERQKNGVWTLTTKLKPGKYKYEFNVNGIYWKHDPSNTNKIVDQVGQYKSILEIAEAAVATLSPATAISVAPDAPKPVTFSLEDPIAREVSVGGFFNLWNPNAHPMNKDERGVWKATVDLKPGRYPYKFYVDGKWQTDPRNPITVPDGQGGNSSVITVGQ